MYFLQLGPLAPAAAHWQVWASVPCSRFWRKHRFLHFDIMSAVSSYDHDTYAKIISFYFWFKKSFYEEGMLNLYSFGFTHLLRKFSDSYPWLLICILIFMYCITINLHPTNKSYLVMLYDISKVLLNSVCSFYWRLLPSCSLGRLQSPWNVCLALAQE